VHLNEILSQLHLKWMWKPTISTGIGFCENAVWSRAFRRRAAKKEEDINETQGMALGFKIYINREESSLMEDAQTKVTVRWLKGHDSVLFESFCGMAKRKLEESIQ
jgi:23S rRNA (adenine1618-N6)-methyltransferase